MSSHIIYFVTFAILACMAILFGSLSMEKIYIISFVIAAYAIVTIYYVKKPSAKRKTTSRK